MKDRNENRQGYKKTKLGWIPRKWGTQPLKLVTNSGQKIVYGIVQAGPHVENGVPYIRSTDVGGKIQTHKLLKTSEEIAARYSRSEVKPGDIIFSLRGNIGETSIVPSTLPRANLTQGTARISVSSLNCNHFVRYSFENFFVKRRIFGVSKGSTFREISLEDLRQIHLPLPPLPEQKKIAEILSTWDEAIEQMRKLIDAKERHKKALMQQLLTGKTRLPGFGEPTKNDSRFPRDRQSLRAKEIFEVRSIKNYGNEQVLSVTQDKGIVYRDSLERRIETSAANTNSYKLVEPGDYVISLRSFQGGLEFSKYRGIVSPAYHVIRQKIKIDNVFYRYYFKSYDFIGHLAIAVIGIRDGKQVSYNDFAFMYLPYPPVAEQKMIGAVLSAADEEIKVFQNKLAAVEKQKRGLMQKLLTGEVRVSA